MTTIDLGDVSLEAHLRIPSTADRLAVFVHGSGSSRHSPRNNHVAERLEHDGVASLLFDLLTEAEDTSRAIRFDIDLLTRRVLDVLAWTRGQSELSDLALHLFGASTGAAAAIRAAAGSESHTIQSVVSRGGRPDLAGDALGRLRAPCLLIVGGNDPQVLEMNRDAQAEMACKNELRVVEGATHLFQEPGALDTVAEHASDWIRSH
ncbi:MAG: dienelactone hydrolase family protein [Spirochaetota bacterium]